MNKYKIVAIIGKAGSGKDSLLKNLIKNNKEWNEIISCTTRPPRDNEENGNQYYFLSNEEFAKKILNNEMLEAAVFNDWCYGTAYDALDINKINIGVFNPTGIETLLTLKDIDLQVFYLRCSDKERLIRQLNREDNPDIKEIFRRYKTDEEDFFDLEFDYIELINEKVSDLCECERTIVENIV